MRDCSELANQKAEAPFSLPSHVGGCSPSHLTPKAGRWWQQRRWKSFLIQSSLSSNLLWNVRAGVQTNSEDGQTRPSETGHPHQHPPSLEQVWKSITPCWPSPMSITTMAIRPLQWQRVENPTENAHWLSLTQRVLMVKACKTDWWKVRHAQFFFNKTWPVLNLV